MSTRTLKLQVTSSILTLRHGRPRTFLAGVITAVALGSSMPAHAGMGETDATIGAAIVEPANTIVLGCVLGGACADPSGVLFRLLSADVASQVFRGGPTVETDKTINGIGFGSFMSAEDSLTNLIDTFCWSGPRTRNPGGKLSQSVRDCVRIFRGSGSVSGGSVITVRKDANQCNDVRAQFVRPPESFDYLVKVDPLKYGQAASVQVLTCSGVVARFSSDVAQSAVNIKAHRSMSGFDCKLKIGGVCYS